MVCVTTAHLGLTLLDKNKGSMTNRIDCAKEHAKNDLVHGAKMTTAVGTTAAVVGLAYAAKTGKGGKFVSCAAKYVTTAMANLGKGLSKVSSKVGMSKVAEEFAKHPTKAGLLAFGAAAGVYCIKTLADYCTKMGRINQKYEDSAAIETQTKRVVLA